jgi:hypothetical protein
LEQATRFIVSCLESSRCYNSAISLPRRRPRHPSSWSALSGWGILFDDQVCALPSFRACLVSGAMPAFEILAEEPALDSGTPTTLPAKERKTGVRRFYALGAQRPRTIAIPIYQNAAIQNSPRRISCIGQPGLSRKGRFGGFIAPQQPIPSNYRIQLSLWTPLREGVLV